MTRTRPAVSIPVAVLTMLASTTAVLLMSTQPASARCHPTPAVISAGAVSGVPYSSWGLEDYVTGTCDGDYTYHGRLYDEKTDGSCVWVEYADMDYTGLQAQSCDAAGVEYWYFDTRGNNAAYMRVCRNQGCDGWLATFGY
jgi:hypothetical protein